MKDLYVVAHTQSEHHVQGRVGGWYDTPLTALGREQAARVAEQLAAWIAGPADIVASDLKRAAETAAIIGEHLGLAVELDPDLRERSLGSAGGKPGAWLDERFVPPPKGEGRLDHRDGIDDAESKREFATRVYRAVERIIARERATQIVVTTASR
jgi:2,3-bisphosphoglycerate-dependent phosphoglycerate mutase